MKTGKDSKDWPERVSLPFLEWWRAQKEQRELARKGNRKGLRTALHKNLKRLTAASRRLQADPRSKAALAGKVWSAILVPLDGEPWPWPTADPSEVRDYVTNPEANSI